MMEYLFIGLLLAIAFNIYSWKERALPTAILFILSLVILFGWPVFIFSFSIVVLISYVDKLRGIND